MLSGVSTRTIALALSQMRSAPKQTMQSHNHGKRDDLHGSVQTANWNGLPWRVGSLLLCLEDFLSICRSNERAKKER